MGSLNSRRPYRGGVAAFTLVEMFVVLAVLVVLVGLLFPAIEGMRNKGSDAVCMANLRKGSQAINLYVSDNGKYPYSYSDANFPKEEYEAAGYQVWTYSLYPHHQGDQTFVCPLFKKRYRVWDAGAPAGINTPEARTTYGMNYYLSWLKPAQVANPAATMVFMESVDTAYGWMNINIRYATEIHGAVDIHQKGSNYLFADGHVEWRKKGDMKGIVVQNVETGVPIE